MNNSIQILNNGPIQTVITSQEKKHNADQMKLRQKKTKHGSIKQRSRSQSRYSLQFNGLSRLSFRRKSTFTESKKEKNTFTFGYAYEQKVEPKKEIKPNADWSTNKYTVELKPNDSEQAVTLELCHNMIHRILKIIMLPKYKDALSCYVDEIISENIFFDMEEKPKLITFLIEIDRKTHIDRKKRDLELQNTISMKMASPNQFATSYINPLLQSLDKSINDLKIIDIYNNNMQGAFSTISDFFNADSKKLYSTAKKPMLRFYFKELFKSVTYIKIDNTKRRKKLKDYITKESKFNKSETILDAKENLSNQTVLIEHKRRTEYHIHEYPIEIIRLTLLLRAKRQSTKTSSEQQFKLLLDATDKQHIGKHYYDLRHLKPFNLTTKETQCLLSSKADITVDEWIFLLENNLLVINNDLFNHLYINNIQIKEWFIAHQHRNFTLPNGFKTTFSGLMLCYKISECTINVYNISDLSNNKLIELYFKGFNKQNNNEALKILFWEHYIKNILINHEYKKIIDNEDNSLLHLILQQNTLTKEEASIFSSLLPRLPLFLKNKAGKSPLDYLIEYHARTKTVLSDKMHIAVSSKTERLIPTLDEKFSDIFIQDNSFIRELFYCYTKKIMMRIEEYSTTEILENIDKLIQINHIPSLYMLLLGIKNQNLSPQRTALIKYIQYICTEKRIKSLAQYPLTTIIESTYKSLLNQKERKLVEVALKQGDLETAHCLYLEKIKQTEPNLLIELKPYVDYVLSILSLYIHNEEDMMPLLYTFFSESKNNTEKDFFHYLLINRLITNNTICKEREKIFFIIPIYTYFYLYEPQMYQNNYNINPSDMISIREQIEKKPKEVLEKKYALSNTHFETKETAEKDVNVDTIELLSHNPLTENKENDQFISLINQTATIDALIDVLTQTAPHTIERQQGIWIKKLLFLQPTQSELNAFMKTPALQAVLKNINLNDQEKNTEKFTKYWMYFVIPQALIQDLHTFKKAHQYDLNDKPSVLKLKTEQLSRLRVAFIHQHPLVNEMIDNIIKEMNINNPLVNIFYFNSICAELDKKFELPMGTIKNMVIQKLSTDYYRKIDKLLSSNTLQILEATNTLTEHTIRNTFIPEALIKSLNHLATEQKEQEITMQQVAINDMLSRNQQAKMQCFYHHSSLPMMIDKIITTVNNTPHLRNPYYFNQVCKMIEQALDLDIGSVRSLVLAKIDQSIHDPNIAQLKITLEDPSYNQFTQLPNIMELCLYPTDKNSLAYQDLMDLIQQLKVTYPKEIEIFFQNNGVVSEKRLQNEKDRIIFSILQESYFIKTMRQITADSDNATRHCLMKIIQHFSDMLQTILLKDENQKKQTDTFDFKSLDVNIKKASDLELLMKSKNEAQTKNKKSETKKLVDISTITQRSLILHITPKILIETLANENAFIRLDEHMQ